MRKIFLKSILLIGLFLGSWFLLVQINFMKLLNIEELSIEAEEKVGDFIWDYFQPKENEIKNDSIKKQLNTFLNRICVNNQLKPEDYNLHIIKNKEPNAYALPANRIIFHHSLILTCSNAEEYCAILAHEIAHLKHNHVMKKLRQELGMSVLLSISQNGMGSSIGRQIIGLLSGNAYSRKYEREADKTAVDFLTNAKINPEHFANILNRITNNNTDILTKSEWISTHPETKKRCRTINQLKKQKPLTPYQIISKQKWALIQDHLKSELAIQ